MAARQQSRIPREAVLVSLVFLPFLIRAIIHLVELFRVIPVRNDVGFPEGACIYAFLTALRTGKLYSPILAFPWNEQVYGPVFYLTGAALARLAHGDAMLTTMLVRSASLLAFLATAALVGYLSWRLERQKRWAAIGIVLCLACPWAVPGCATARADALSIFFIFAALAAYEAAEGSSRLIFWAGVFGALSCLTKQSTAPTLFALALDTLIARRFRNTAALIAGSASITAPILLVLWLRHEPFLANFTAMRHTMLSWPTTLPVFIDFLRTYQASVIPISIALLGAALGWRRRSYQTILLAAAFSWPANIAALANVGAYSNYLIVPWLLTILLVPAGLARIEDWSRRWLLLPVALIVLSAFLLIHQRNLLWQRPPGDLDTDTVASLRVLSDQPYLEMRSAQPQLLDPFYYHLLSLQKLWSAAPIRQKLGSEAYDLVLIGGGDGPAASDFHVQGWRGISMWGADILGEMNGHYRALCELPGILALVPRDRPGTLQNSDMTRIFREPCRATSRTPQLAAGLQ